LRRSGVGRRFLIVAAKRIAIRATQEMLMALPVPCRPLRIELAYRDLAELWRLVEANAPYRSMAGLDGYREYGGLSSIPWFREHWALDGRPLIPGIEELLHHPNFIQGARAVFDGKIVRPMTVLINLMGPMPAGAPHIDTPSFRGAERTNFPLWLLLVMGASGLFQRWSLSLAGAVSWFYEGEGGDFEYWPHGEDRPPARERPPFGNTAIVTDSDRMYHRVGAIGRSDEYLAAGTISASSKLLHEHDGGWQIIDDNMVRATYPPRQVRVSLLWKAIVFDDEAAAAVFEQHTDDITLERAAGIFCSDLRRRGVVFTEPVDPARDPQWAQTLIAAYPLHSFNPKTPIGKSN